MSKISLNKIVQATGKDLFTLFKNVGEAKGMAIHSSTNYVYLEGTLPVTLLAHVDTVHLNLPTPDKTFYDPKNRVMWSPDGIGGDDRCGIFAILAILKSGLTPSVILLDKEEKGLVGAKDFAKDFTVKPNGMKFLLEIDRRGRDDVVYYDCGNVEFQKYIESFGFKKQWGSSSDIREVMPAWNIAGCNVSAGYFNEHHSDEYIELDALWSTIVKVKTILSQNFEVIPEYDYQSTYKPYVYQEYDYSKWSNGYYDAVGKWHWGKKPDTTPLLPVTTKGNTPIQTAGEREVEVIDNTKPVPSLDPFGDDYTYLLSAKPLELTDVIKAYRTSTGIEYDVLDNLNGQYYLDFNGCLLFKDLKTNVAYYVQEDKYMAMRKGVGETYSWLTYRDLEGKIESIMVK
jgi:hypothetical protein